MVLNLESKAVSCDEICRSILITKRGELAVNGVKALGPKSIFLRLWFMKLLIQSSKLWQVWSELLKTYAQKFHNTQTKLCFSFNYNFEVIPKLYVTVLKF